MALFDWLKGALPGSTASLQTSQASEQNQQRLAEWEAALQTRRLPDFVTQRLGAAAQGKTPWLATMTPAELLLAKSHGIRPIATVSGTCWYHYGYSWTKGHSAGWNAALTRLRLEALAAGANAVVDVKMRRIYLDIGESMDFTLVGTAVQIDGLPANDEPVISTVSALEFVRLLEADIVPVGIAVGAHYDWLQPGIANVDGAGTWKNQPLHKLGNFWERVRRHAHAELRHHAAKQGTGVLAHTHFGQLLRTEQDDTTQFLGRHIVIGTVVDDRRGAKVPHPIRPVIDMTDGDFSLGSDSSDGRNNYDTNDEEGEI